MFAQVFSSTTGKVIKKVRQHIYFFRGKKTTAITDNNI